MLLSFCIELVDYVEVKFTGRKISRILFGVRMILFNYV
jgi:hypothetical protein